jgi:hypothetical protein
MIRCHCHNVALSSSLSSRILANLLVRRRNSNTPFDLFFYQLVDELLYPIGPDRLSSLKVRRKVMHGIYAATTQTLLLFRLAITCAKKLPKTRYAMQKANSGDVEQR